jgi:S1-C subfamily serine protease
VFEGTTLAGLEIYAGSDARTFARLGLLDGDVIRSVDGVPVSDAAATIAQLESLTQGRAVTVDVLRQGHLETISLDGAVIAAARAPASISSRESKYPR